MAHAISWFEIPVNDFKRARAFYEKIFSIKMTEMDPSMKSAMFPADWQKGEVGGAISEYEGMEPSDKGVTVYLNGGDDLSVILDRVEEAGGSIVMPKAEIPIEDAGFTALFMDTEGNKIGLHSNR